MSMPNEWRQCPRCGQWFYYARLPHGKNLKYCPECSMLYKYAKRRRLRK